MNRKWIPIPQKFSTYQNISLRWIQTKIKAKIGLEHSFQFCDLTTLHFSFSHFNFSLQFFESANWKFLFKTVVIKCCSSAFFMFENLCWSLLFLTSSLVLKIGLFHLEMKQFHRETRVWLWKGSLSTLSGWRGPFSCLHMRLVPFKVPSGILLCLVLPLHRREHP